MKRIFTLCFLLILLSREGSAQTTVTIGGGSSGVCPFTPTATWATPPSGISFSNWSRGSGVSCASFSNALSGSGFNTANANASYSANKYYSVTITADASHTFTLNSITWLTGTSSGGCSFDIFYSNNGGIITSFGAMAQTNTTSNIFNGSVTVASGTSIQIYLVPSGTGAGTTTVKWTNGSTINLTATTLTFPNDAGISTLFPPVCSGNQIVSATLKNYGTSTLSSVTINWSVNGVSQLPYIWTGSLASNSTINVNIGTFNFATATNYTITTSTSLPNGVSDGNTANDGYISPTFQTGLFSAMDWRIKHGLEYRS